MEHLKEQAEQPNQEIMIVKTIQSLISVVNNNLSKLPDSPLKSMALDDINIFETGVLHDLQKEYE